MKQLWANHKLAVTAFAAAVAVLCYFAFQTLSSTLYWMDPAHRDQDLAPWMTPRYVARSYQIPPRILAPALFLDQDAAPRRVSVGSIALQNEMTLDELQDRIEAAAATWRETQE